MRNLDLEQLRTFVAAHDAGTLSGASALVFRSQSAVSEQIQKLEQTVGAPLLLRSRAGVALTDAGQRLIAHARQILALSELALRDARQRLQSAEVRLAISDYFRPAEISELLGHIARHCPQLRLRVTLGQSAELSEAHARRQHDLCLTMGVEDAASGASPGALLRREPLAWVAAPKFDAASTPLPLVLLPASCNLHRTALRELERSGIGHRVAHLCSGVSGLQSALTAGLGVGCLNASAVPATLAPAPRSLKLPKLPRVAFRLLPPPKDSEPALEDACDVLREFFR